MAPKTYRLLMAQPQVGLLCSAVTVSAPRGRSIISSDVISQKQILYLLYVFLPYSTLPVDREFLIIAKIRKVGTRLELFSFFKEVLAFIKLHTET